MSNLFEKMISDMSSRDTASMLDACMSSDPKKVGKVPLRYRILALGFVQKMSVAEVNEKLKEAGCDQLYARNFKEITLLYAFIHALSYKQWRELYESVKKLENDIPENAAFSNKQISLKDLKNYVDSASDMTEGVLYTRHGTRYLEKQLDTIDDMQSFTVFLEQNIREFSNVREKSRYYFCKYLVYFIEYRIKAYLDSVENGFGQEQALEDLLVLRGIKDLSRKKHTVDEARTLLQETSLSCGGIYDLFNQFYFEYVSNDWMDVLIDYYGDLSHLSADSKKELALSLRHYNPAWKGLSDAEVIARKEKELEEKEKELDRVYSLEGSNRGYQKNRSGEKSVRNYIRGTLDLDRTTLISYLLFFGYVSNIPEEQRISEKRLNTILKECRMGELSPDNDFDYFVLEYLEAEDPEDYLMETVTNYAFDEQNFFLYHMYNESVSNDEQNKKIFE